MVIGPFLLAAAISIAAPAAPPPSAFYTNTVEVEAPAGIVRIWWNRDWSFIAVLNGVVYKGHWEVKDGKMCHTIVAPKPQTGTGLYCHVYSLDKNVVDSWVDGDEKFTLKAGRSASP